MFTDDDTPIDQLQAQMADQRSVLDTVLADARSVGKRVDHHDAQKLEEYFDSIRDIKTRIAKEESWRGVPVRKPSKPLAEPAPSLEGKEEIRVMYDLMATALEVDATRVITYRMPADSLMQSIGGNEPAHLVSHYSERGGSRKDLSQVRDQTHSTLLAGFFDKLKATTESDGSSIFDQTAITFGSNIRTMHSLTNYPTLIAGGGAGIEQGRHLVLENSETPLCNLWLTQLRGCGLEAESFGDSTGIIEELG